MKGLQRSLREIGRYPSAVAGLVIILLLVSLAVYTVITIPYDEAIMKWRGGESIWYNSPRNAQPKWVNWFSSSKKPETITIASDSELSTKDYRPIPSKKTDVLMSFTFDHTGDGLPQEITLDFTAAFKKKEPVATITLDTPDGRTIFVREMEIWGEEVTLKFSKDAELALEAGGYAALFADPASPDPDNPQALKGTYTLNVDVQLLELESAADAAFSYLGPKATEPITLNTDAEGATKEITPVSPSSTDVVMSYTFDYAADDFPQELSLLLTSDFEEKNPFATVTLDTPDGRTLLVGDVGLKENETVYNISQDERLTGRLDGLAPGIGLFADPESENPKNPDVLNGTYTLNVSMRLFEKDSVGDAEFAFMETASGETISMTSGHQRASRTSKIVPPEKTDVIMTFTFDVTADEFPQELSLYFTSEFVEKEPFASVTLDTPDGRTLRVGDLGIKRKETFRISQEDALVRRLEGLKPEIGLFADPESPDPENPQVLKGTYTLNVIVLLFEEGDADATFVSYGTVFGMAGTDHLRRDLMLPLMWGAPIALLFGLLASGGISILTMIISAIGGWFGGVVDGIIQRITEVNLTLPFLSILIMIGTFYSKSIWTILGATIVLSIFGAAIKTYRSIFMQIRESSYIEAAQAYGASDGRIIFRYLIPRLIPLLLPGLVLGVPAFVFLEASLAVLGLGDPVLPTWGKIINDAWVNAALYNGHYYWILEPAVLLMITGLAFAMLGYSLDRIFNPRLRGL